MSDLYELTDADLKIPGVVNAWVYDPVLKTFTRNNNPADHQPQTIVSKKYLPKGSLPDDVSIRWAVGEVNSNGWAFVGFNDWDRRFTQGRPNILCIEWQGTTFRCLQGDASVGLDIGGGGLPGGLTAATNDEWRIQIHRVAGNYVAEFKWRRPPGGAEQVVRTAPYTNSQLTALLSSTELFMKLSGTQAAQPNPKIVKNLQMEVTDAGTTWLLDVTALDAEAGGVVSSINENCASLSVEAGPYIEDTLPIPVEGQLWPLGDGRDWIE